MKKIKDYKKSAKDFKTLRERALKSYWKNKFMTRYDIQGNPEEGYTFEAKKFILKMLWEKGYVGCYLADFKDSKLDDDGAESKYLIFTNYSVSGFKRYREPAIAFPIWDNFVDPATPKKDGGIAPLKVGEEIILGYAHYDRTPVEDLIEQEIDFIVRLEAAKRNNIFAWKKPLGVKVSAESKDSVLEAMSDYDDDVPFLLVPMDNGGEVGEFNSAPAYIIDKLDEAIAIHENKIKTILGLNNTSIQKHEHLLKDEVNANNAEIGANTDVIATNIEVFLDKIEQAFGVSARLEVKVEEAEYQEKEEGAEDGRDEDNDK